MGKVAMNQAMIHPGVEKRVTRKVEVAPDLTAMAGTVAEEIALAAGAGTTAEAINNLPVIKQIQKSPQSLRGFLSSIQALIVPAFTLSPFTTLIVTMTCQTGEISHRSRMAGAASRAPVVDTGSFLVHARFGMRQVEARRDPGCSRVAFCTIGVERSEVKIRVGMTGYALSG